MELSVLTPDERFREAVGVVYEVEGEAALDAEVALVRDVARVGGDLLDAVRLRIDVDVDLAADAAERAGGLDLLQGRLRPFRPLLELLVDRARGADAEAPSAELALGVEPGKPPSRDNARLRPASLERERGALHHLLRVADAARAKDASVGVVAHERVAVVVRLPLGVREDEGGLRSEILRQVCELVRSPAGIRVQVLGEEHLRERALVLGHG